MKKDHWVKRARQHSPHKVISKSTLKRSTIQNAWDMILPGVIHKWIAQKKLLTDIPIEILKEAILKMHDESLEEVRLTAKDQQVVILTLDEVKAIIGSRSGPDLEETLSLIQRRCNAEFQSQILGHLLQLPEKSPKEILNLPPREIHAALFLTHGAPFGEIIRGIPHHLLRRVVPLLSQDLLWRALRQMDEDQAGVAAEQISDQMIEHIFTFEVEEIEELKLSKIILAMTSEQIRTVVIAVIADVKKPRELRMGLLRKVLAMMSPGQIPTAIMQMGTPLKRELLERFWSRPMGISTSIANGKMSAHQIAAGIVHHRVVLNILNSVEWMDQRQRETTQSMLDLVVEMARKLVRDAREHPDEMTMPDPLKALWESCKEISKLRFAKEHPFHNEIYNISKITELAPALMSVE